MSLVLLSNHEILLRNINIERNNFANNDLQTLWPAQLAEMTTTKTILTPFSYYRLTNSKVVSYIYVIKHMVNATSCTVELWTHLGDVLGGLVSSHVLKV